MSNPAETSPLPRRANATLNRSELEDRKSALRSTPRMITIGAHNNCNAKCVFCLEGKYTRFTLERYKTFFEGRMGRFIRQAEDVTFTGFGEILWIPEAEEFLDCLNETLPDTRKMFTTNGTPLRPAIVERLAKGRYHVQISLHASNAKLHEELTLLPGEFETVVANVRNLTALRDALGPAPKLTVEILNVLTTRNLSDLTDLLKLAWDLRVDAARSSYVTMFVPDHIELSPFFDQERANRELGRALLHAVDARSGGSRPVSVVLPPFFGSLAPTEPTLCAQPWEHVYVESQGSVLPCCFWGGHLGDLEKGDDVEGLWNGPAYQALRGGMAAGKPLPDCRSCVRYTNYNVNSILCHVTNRPPARAVLLAEVARRGLLIGTAS